MPKPHTFILLCLLLIPSMLFSTTLSDLAENMAPGTWAELNTFDFEDGDILYTTKDNPGESINYANRIIDFAESAAWDSNTKKFMFLGAPSGSAWRFIVYDEASNTWNSGPLPRPCMAYGGNETDPNITYCGGHAFDWNAFDPDSGRFFHTYWKFGPELDIYTPSNNQWARSSTPPTQIGNLFAGTNYRYGAMEWFSGLNSLLTLVGGRIVRINLDSNQWEILPQTYAMGSYHNVMQYSPVQNIMVFGGGNDWDPSPSNTPNYRDLYRMDASGDVVKLSDAPFYVRVTDNRTGSHPGTLITADPISGNFLFLNKQNLFYELDAVSDSWTQLANAPINSHAVSASIAEYGVIMFVSSESVWIYKHSIGTLVNLTVSSTQVNSGDTVVLSWSSSNSNSCLASGGWSGSRAVSGSETSLAITASTTFILNCTGDTGSSSASVTVNINSDGAISLGSGVIITNALVYDESNGADWSIQSNLQTTDTMYGDRSYSFTQIPADLIGQEWLSTANDSRTFTGEELVTFTVAQDAEVFILHRDDIANKPGWLSGWTDTDLDAINSEPRTYSIFSRNFSAGEILSLGINGSTGSGMYIVIVIASQSLDSIFTDGFE